MKLKLLWFVNDEFELWLYEYECAKHTLLNCSSPILVLDVNRLVMKTVWIELLNVGVLWNDTIFTTL